jgi:hypothetical protein
MTHLQQYFTTRKHVNRREPDEIAGRYYEIILKIKRGMCKNGIGFFY